MNVSIILPTFNNALMLQSTLFSFESVIFPEGSELIVVDNNSTDDTRKIVENFTGRIPIRYAYEPQQGVSAAKNMGLRLALGHLLIFTDDDVRPDPNWIITHLSAYRRNPVGFFWGGPVISEFEGPHPDARLLSIAPASVRGFSLGTAERPLRAGEWFIGANWACTAEALSRVGGFDEAVGPYPGAPVVLTGEETDLQRRLKAAGYTGLYLPAAPLRHVVPARKSTLAHVLQRAESWGHYLGCTASADSVGRTIYAVPLWQYRKCFASWSLAWLKRAAGRDWYQDYKQYRVARGFIRGMAEQQASRQTA